MKAAPFRENSMLFIGWTMALQGTTMKALEKRCEKEGANVSFLLRTLRKGVRYDWTWEVDESCGKFKIYNVKYNDLHNV